jgi:GDPmannose 4,6-dehydratase
MFLHYGDVGDGTGLRRILERVRPDEVYNLAAQSHVRVSFDQPEYTADAVATGTLRLLEALRDFEANSGTRARFYQASSSEMFGSAAPPQGEATPFHPRSPYAVSKVAAHWYAINYREAYGMFISTGILFNHESPRRGETFVSRKVTRAVARIKLGLQGKLYMGNLAAKRDWGFAGDYVEAMWRMMQAEKPGDYVVATGEAHSVRELLQVAFAHLGLDWEKFVEVDPRYFRPAEVDHLCGDATRARKELGWEPKVGFAELVRMMVDADLEIARQEKTLREAGHVTSGRGAHDG